MPKTVNFNVRKVPAAVAEKLMTLAGRADTRRENYIRKLFELHVDQAARAPRTPGRYVLEAPTPEQVAAALAAERAEA